ncbi:MAG: biotin/lipoyl-binding protein [Oceanospirillaceae bacterium]|nr:biotin/lipoyl-binding protein [Oceanospirillaceae bacterium]
MEHAAWYRIAGYCPKLRRHARVYRQRFRGRLTYVLQDRTSGRHHLCSPPAYYMMSLMDGSRTVADIWDMGCAAFPDEVIDKSDVTKLLAMLHSSDVLHGSVPADILELTDRGLRLSRRNRVMRFLNPLALRIPLLDPDDFLTATMPWLRFLFTRWAALAYLLVVGYALVLAGAHWKELTGNITDRVMVAENLLIMLCVFPLVKAIHELGHGFAVKHWGGEVHEIGIMFLVFIPVPYVDASASAAFPNKWQRAFVGAAGILVELMLAALALVVWLTVEEGLLRACAYNVMLIGGISTLFFNGNPLLRYDGYYVLQDILEIPNLGSRCNRFIAYLVKCRLLGIPDLPSPAHSTGEARWMLFYGIASFVYRITIVAAIVLFVASKYFVIGVMLAIWASILMLGVPIFKQIHFLLWGAALRGRRPRALSVVGGGLALVALLFMTVPLPYNTVAEGIVWTPGEGAINSATQGVVEQVYVSRGEKVDRGDVLLRLSDPYLEREVAVHRARVRELELRRDEQSVQDRVGARVVEEQLEQARADLNRAREDLRNLQISASASGDLALPRAADLPGKYVQRGEVLGYVAEFDTPVVRVAVGQDSIEQVRNHTEAVEMRLVERFADVVPARILHEVPSLSNMLPSPALSTRGGGKFLLDASDPQQRSVIERVFNLELAPVVPWPVSKLGMRVYVKFTHGWEPIGWRLYRAARRILLRQLDV